MLELIARFLSYTGIREETFGRLALNDPHLVWKLRRGLELTPEARNHIMLFVQNYEDAKE